MRGNISVLNTVKRGKYVNIMQCPGFNQHSVNFMCHAQ